MHRMTSGCLLAVRWVAEPRLECSPPYTASVDAVIALIEEKLPGWCVMLATTKGGGWWARLRQVDEPQPYWAANAATAPLALLLALCRALQAQEPKP